MQGKKDFTPKLFYSLSLDRLVPEDDFYRKLNQSINLRFLYKQTQRYYGNEGQSSIDPVVFFKICMIGYLNNIVSDRAELYGNEENLCPWNRTSRKTRINGIAVL